MDKEIKRYKDKINERLIDLVAELWISNGGNSTEFDLSEKEIIDTIKTKERERGWEIY